ncbi:MAG: hypothetical protein CUN55_09015 [Phototrophicales bacterium]|nr:MAG: hypothetical protein CUN55_09015 [Phototrophicales bacterium]
MDHLLQSIDAIVAWHNVAGRQGVLCAAADHIANAVGYHYNSRAADHVPYIPHLPIYILCDDPSSVEKQLRYRGGIAGMDFNAIRNTDELASRGIQRALFLPYIRLVDIPLSAEIEWTRYGLPPVIIQHLKNKAIMHNWLMENNFVEHTMNFVACSIEEIPTIGESMVAQIEEMYRDLDMDQVYPLGIMVRGAQTDGNYGAGFLRQLLVDSDGGRRGQIVLKRNGKATDFEFFNDWHSALVALRNHIQYTVATDIEDQVVMTRLLDINVSPGMSAMIDNGIVHPLAFNGQYTEPGAIACTGTCTLTAAIGESYAEQINARYLTQAQTLLSQILERVFTQYHNDITQINGMLNIDMMIVGELERELWRRSDGTHWRDNIARINRQYAPRPYDPSYGLFAEINPRETNWTLAMKAVLQATHRPFTAGQLQAISWGQGVQVVARDMWHLPAQVDMDILRDELLEYHHQLSANEEGFILRMPDNPAGVIMYTPSHDPIRLVEILEGAAQIAEAAVVKP